MTWPAACTSCGPEAGDTSTVAQTAGNAPRIGSVLQKKNRGPWSGGKTSGQEDETVHRGVKTLIKVPQFARLLVASLAEPEARVPINAAEGSWRKMHL